jgi:hypothetical protein
MDFRLTDKKLVHPGLLRVAEMYERLGGDGVMPHRAQFEPRNAPWLYGFIIMMDVLAGAEGGRDYRYTDTGAFWQLTFGFDLTGIRLSEFEACGQLTAVRTNYDHAVEARAPRYRFGRMIWPSGQFIRYERLVLPFAGSDGEVSMLVLAAQSDRSLQEIIACKGLGEPRLELELSAASAAAA